MYIGGLIGYAALNVTVASSSVSADVVGAEGASDVGGLIGAGTNNITITGSAFTGSVSGYSSIG